LKLKLAIYRLIIIGPAAPVQVTISPIAAVTAEEEVASVVSVATTPVVVPQVSLDPALWIKLWISYCASTTHPNKCCNSSCFYCT